MKLFKSARAHLEQIGVQPLQPFQDSHSISTHLKRALPLCIIALAAISSNAFLLFKANNVGEFSLSFYMSITLLGDLLLLGLCKVNLIFAFIDDIQVLIEKRRLRSDL